MRSKNIPHDPTALRIVKEARKEFLTLGFSRVTMDDLAQKMGMSKKTLYLHFSSKEKLLEAVITDKLNNVEQDLQESTGQTYPNLHAKLSATMLCLMGHVQEIQKPYIRDMERHAPELFNRVQKRRQDIIDRHIGAIIEEGVQLGKMRNDIPLRLAMEILMGAVNAVMNPSKMGELGIPPQEALAGIFKLFLEGMLVRKGSDK